MGKFVIHILYQEKLTKFLFDFFITITTNIKTAHKLYCNSIYMSTQNLCHPLRLVCYSHWQPKRDCKEHKVCLLILFVCCYLIVPCCISLIPFVFSNQLLYPLIVQFVLPLHFCLLTYLFQTKKYLSWIVNTLIANLIDLFLSYHVLHVYISLFILF